MIKHLLKLLPIITVLILTGCDTTPTKAPDVTDAKPDQPVEGPLSEIDLLLQQAESATPLVRAQYTLQAAQELLAYKEADRASGLLDNINIVMLPAASQQLYWLLRAQAAEQLQQPILLMQYLSQVQQPTLLSVEDQAAYSQLLIDTQTQAGDFTGLLAKLIETSALTPNEERQPVHNQIWSLLNEYNQSELTEMSANPENSYLEQGWYDLALNVRTAGLDIIKGLHSIRNWQQLWSQHPAASTLPSSIADLIEQNTVRPQHIAVLLPLSGDLSKAGNAIIEGMLAAHFEEQRLGFPTPKVSFYDSTKVDNLFDFYATASIDGIDLVIGPLTKAKVSQLTESPNVSIPTLALNYSGQQAASLDLFQFGLRGEDEAAQAAEFAWQQGYRQALSLTAETTWGHRINKAFEQSWTALGGELVNQQHFGKEGFSNSISELLGIDASEARYKQIRTFLGKKSEFEPRRRQDADFLFLSALAKDARQLKPILAFHYAADVPVIATSHVYTGANPAEKNQDLDGIRFTTTPWVLQIDQPIRDNLEAFRQNTASRFGRLYALGADAYRLSPYLNQLQQVPGAFLGGNTGELRIDANGVVNRSLKWAEFTNGEAREIKQEPIN